MLKSLTISNVQKLSQDMVSKKDFWEKACGDIKKGIYVYRLDKKVFPYLFKKSPIFYIGRGGIGKTPLPERLRWHFTRDNRLTLTENGNVLKWFYQNYYAKKKPFHIDIYNTKNLNLKELENLFLGIFALNHGALPLCNGSFGRDGFDKLYKKYQNHDPVLCEKISKIVRNAR